MDVAGTHTGSGESKVFLGPPPQCRRTFMALAPHCVRYWMVNPTKCFLSAQFHAKGQHLVNQRPYLRRHFFKHAAVSRTALQHLSAILVLRCKGSGKRNDRCKARTPFTEQ